MNTEAMTPTAATRALCRVAIIVMFVAFLQDPTYLVYKVKSPRRDSQG